MRFFLPFPSPIVHRRSKLSVVDKNSQVLSLFLLSTRRLPIQISHPPSVVLLAPCLGIDLYPASSCGDNNTTQNNNNQSHFEQYYPGLSLPQTQMLSNCVISRPIPGGGVAIIVMIMMLFDDDWYGSRDDCIVASTLSKYQRRNTPR